MPPKRKRVEASAVEPSTRGTRSSTRQAALAGSSNVNDAPKSELSDPLPAKKASTRKKAPPKASESSDGEPAAKKAKSKATKTTTARKSKKAVDTPSGDVTAGASENTHSFTLDDVPPRMSAPIPPPATAPPITVLPPVLTSEPKPVAPSPPVQTKSQVPPQKMESYSPDRAISLFKKYSAADEPDVIGPEGFEKLCADTQIPLDSALPLIMAWQFNAKEMAKLTKEEWIKGTEALKISSLPQLSMAVSDLEQLLIKAKPSAKSSGGKKDPYDKHAYAKYAADPKAAFQTLYTYCFNLAKPEQSRNIDMDTSVAFWSVLLVPRHPLMSEVLEFIAEKEGSYKATNKDLWSMMLEFCRTVKPSLQDYEADGAWPTLLDDFVAWKKGKLTNGNGAASAE